MQQFIYSIVRTFPFWAIPLGAALISSTWAKRVQKMSAKKKMLLLLFGIFLVLDSVVFLYFQGHEKAVPFVHELFYGPGVKYR
jgi:hypothetical protein